MQQGGFPEAEVFEIKKIDYNSPIVFAGFVGAGLAGPLSVGYIIEKLQMEEVAYRDQNTYHHLRFLFKVDCDIHFDFIQTKKELSVQ